MATEEKNDLVRSARLTPQTAILAALLGVGGVGGFGANQKLGEQLELARETRASVSKLEGAVEKLNGGFTELRTRVEASEKLELDRRLRAIEQLGLERRLEVLEREAKDGRK